MPSSSQNWSPFDCLVVGNTTAAGLLQHDTSPTEVELLVQDEVELRAAENDPLVPLNASNAVDETKRSSDWIDRAVCQVIVTTHRLVFFSSTRQARYIHLSNVFAVSTERHYFKSPKIVLSTAVGELLLAYNSASSTLSDKPQKQCDECLEHLQKCLSRQQWTVDETAATKQRQSRQQTTSRKVGVDAILSANKTRHRQAAALTDTAFGGDAETLLREATELVGVIQKYVATLDREQNDADAAESEKLVSLLSDMGMTSALKKADYKGREAAYYDQTARQLADFLTPRLKTNPTMTLTDVYCVFNRARGSHLLSPEDLLTAVERMEGLQLGLSVHTFPGGLKVIQDDRAVNDDVLAGKFLKECQRSGVGGSVTALHVSRVFHVSAVLAMEQLQAVERTGALVRDETLESVRFYPNKFDEFVAAL